MIGLEPYLTKLYKKNPDIKTLVASFRRPVPENLVYYRRLYRELRLIIKNNFAKCFLQVMDILEITEGIPHIIRGSSGSSLTCYLLGITSFDPIVYNISLARFMNSKRKGLPDIDIDFPYNKRDYIFQKIYEKWGNKVARISNHNMYHERSALREAIRDEGFRKRLPKYFSMNKLFEPETAKAIKEKKEDLIGTFRCYSLHCGGVVIFDEEIPQEMLLKDTQLKLNKDDVENEGFIKIDILSNRGLAQLFSISSTPLNEYPRNDLGTMKTLIYGDNIGLTFAESPGMRKLFLKYQPKNVDEIAKCLALIRPSASHSYHGHKEKALIYDDDAIQYIQEILDCDEGTADQYRKAFSKNKRREKEEFIKLIEHKPNKKDIIENLNNLRYYSFCKSHAYSYAQLVWALAYNKTHNPREFILGTLNHTCSMYRTWVHMCEAKRYGLEPTIGKRPWKIVKDKLVSRSSFSVIVKSEPWAEYKKYGYWTSREFLPGMYYKKQNNKVFFRGLIAAYRTYKGKTLFVTLGYDNGKYIDIAIKKKTAVSKRDIIEGEGYYSGFMVNATKFVIAYNKMPNHNQGQV